MDNYDYLVGFAGAPVEFFSIEAAGLLAAYAASA